MEAVSVIFVLSKDLVDESQASEIMLQAFEACQQNKVQTAWIREEEIHKKELKKTDFIVFDNFEGKDFERILEAKSASILGPWCILICLMEGKKIPNYNWPIYNVAMYECIVTSSHLPKASKTKICELVHRMGGYYSDSLTENTTHVITDSVKSAKYMKAIEMKIKVLTPLWVDAVWEASQEANVHCNDKQFDKFKCLPLHKLIICTTGITSVEMKEKVMRMVTENGGEFTGKLNLKTTDFLICEGTNGAMSLKYKEARKTENVTCVTMQWLYDSIEKGYCLPHHDYAVKKNTSTPQKNFINPDFSTMSAIDQSKCERSSIDETLVRKTLDSNASTPTSGIKRKVFTECEYFIQNIDVKKAKRSGQFLDGCSVYLVGFKDDHREKLCRIINASGATRCDDISDRVTHVLVGDPECHELKVLKSKGLSCSFVTLQWLLDSIEKKRPCAEDESYLVSNLRDESNFRSPSGKKGLSLLRSRRTITEMDVTLSQKDKENLEEAVDLEAEREIMKQYMIPEQTGEEDTLANILKNANYDSERMGGPDSQSRNGNTETNSTEEERQTQYLSQPLDLFRGLSFYLTDFDEEQVSHIEEQIVGALGCVSKEFREANYVVGPSFITKPLPYDVDVCINDLWIYECITEEELLPIRYYHRPLLIKNPSVLEDCVVTISGYVGYERNFLSSLIVMLGGVAQEQFCRITCDKRNVLGSTHLVTAEAGGKKYAGALKWGLPAVDKDWLIGCAGSEIKLPEQDHLVSGNGSRIDRRSENTKVNPSISLESLKISANADQSRQPTDKPENSRNNCDSSKTIENDRVGSDFESKLEKEMNSLLNGADGKRLSTPSGEPSCSNRDTEGFGNFSFPTHFSTDGESQATPESSFAVPRPRSRRETVGSAGLLKTPDSRDDEPIYSQVTPVNKIMSAVRMTNLLGTPDSPQSKLPWEVDTPETPYGLCFTPNPSKSLKKGLLRFINGLPDKNTPLTKRRLSTPLSELKRRLWEHIGSSSQTQDQGESESQRTGSPDEEEESEQTNTQTMLVNSKLQQLEVLMAAASNSANKSRRQRKVEEAVPEPATDFHIRESQPCTVQWDYGKDTQEEPSPQSKIFMISGVSDLELKAKLISHLKELGGTVSETNCYDPSATHLLCSKPARNEKTLSCMAAGKWILHIEYVNACIKAGKFLNEEDYEFGNPNSIGKITIELDRDVELRMQAVYYWRNEIARTGRGAFQDMRAIIIAEKKQALDSVIRAGGGTVVEAAPPFDDVVHATHCLMEAKCIPNFSLYEPLAKQGIYCVNTVYLSDYLHRTNRDIKDAILPFYQKYF